MIPVFPRTATFICRRKGHDAVLARIMAEPLVREPGKEIEYSDLGFILLGEIVERLTGDPLDEFAQGHFRAPGK